MLAGGGDRGTALNEADQQKLARVAVEHFPERKVPRKQGGFWNPLAAPLKVERGGKGYTPGSCQRRLEAMEAERRIQVLREQFGEEVNEGSWAQSLDDYIKLKKQPLQVLTLDRPRISDHDPRDEDDRQEEEGEDELFAVLRASFRRRSRFRSRTISRTT